jgi:hypothetical protein
MSAQHDKIADKVFPLHRKAVEETVALLAGSLGWTAEERQASLGRVTDFYDGTPSDSRLMACHADPFDSACDFAPARIEYGDRMATFERIREPYGELMARLDDTADAALARADGGESMEALPPGEKEAAE